MAATERVLLELLQRTKQLYTDMSHSRPAVTQAEASWDEALDHLDECISALGLGVYLATESMADEDKRPHP